MILRVRRRDATAQTARHARFAVAARATDALRFVFSVATTAIGFVICRTDTFPFLSSIRRQEEHAGVFAAGLDFAELEQAASVDEADEWTSPVVREPRPDVARPRFLLLKTTIALNPRDWRSRRRRAWAPLFRREHPADAFFPLIFSLTHSARLARMARAPRRRGSPRPQGRRLRARPHEPG